MRARPKPTQLEHLSDASFSGKLLVLPANVRLDWKVIARYKHSSLLASSSATKEKSFITLVPGDYHLPLRRAKEQEREQHLKLRFHVRFCDAILHLKLLRN